MSIRTRVIISIAAVLLYGWVNFLLAPIGTVVSGGLAGSQFNDSDSSYITTMWGLRLFSDFGIPFVILLVALAATWWAQIRSGWKALFGALLVAFTLSVALQPQTAEAYYDKVNYTEAYFILPNESAFYVPDTGANKTNQSQFGSEAYYEERKVAAKRFVIPHTKFTGSGYWSDYFVPAGRLIIVDRTPYNREWVASSSRGTSKLDQSFPCQSKEGLNIRVEVAIAASVTEKDASRFLYHFGVNPPKGDRSKPEVIFNSVYYGRSLTQVMDGVGRGKVQALACREIGMRSFNQTNTESVQILDALQKSSSEFFLARGITLDFIGWAGTFTFDSDIQKALNDRFIAETVDAALPVLERRAQILTMQKWDGRLPLSTSDKSTSTPFVLFKDVDGTRPAQR